MDKVTSINGNEVVFASGATFDIILAENDVDLIEKLTKAGANDYFKQDLRGSSFSIETAKRQKYRNTKVLIQLKTTQGEVFTWGSKDIPVRCKIDSQLNGDKWTFYRSAPTPIII